jgi:MbtH protein
VTIFPTEARRDQGDDMAFDDNGQEFLVVANADLQYSVWPATMALPPGWSSAGPAGHKADCLAYISAVWADMNPINTLEG